MKKVMSYLIIFCSFFFILISASSNNFITFLDLYKTQQKNLNKLNNEEGFSSGTKIATRIGLMDIEALNASDIIIGYADDGSCYEQTIVSILSTEVPEYIRIITDDEIICTGAQQKFYVSEENTWISANHLQQGYSLVKNHKETCRIIGIEKIKQAAILYKLTTSSHTFCITPSNIHVHNSDLEMIAIGCLTTINPITATIGVTIAIGIGAVLMYESLHKSPVSFACNQQSDNNELYMYERKYYEQRKYDLCKLKNDFITIKNGLEAITKLCNTNKTIFTHNFLQPLQFDSIELSENISPCDEQNLNEQHKENLRKKREIELRQIEKEIIELQTCISFHFNELIERMQNAFQKYDNYMIYTKKAINEWNAHCNNISDSIALYNFEATLKTIYLIEIIETRILELQCSINYYKSPNNAFVLKQTTNILEIIEAIEKSITEKENSLKEVKKTLILNKSIDERYFLRHSINLNALHNNIVRKIIKEAQQSEYQEFNFAQKKYINITRHNTTISQTNNVAPCQCGCKCFNQFTCDCHCGCVCGKNKQERKINKITKQEFFNSKRIKENYAHLRNGVYKLKENGQAIAKNAYYLQWDHLHNDVEAYNKSKIHMGSIDPEKLNFYKPAVPTRLFPLK